MNNLQIGQRIDVWENTRDHYGVYEIPVIIKGSWCAGFIKNSFPVVRMTNGNQTLVDPKEVKKVGTLVIKTIK